MTLHWKFYLLLCFVILFWLPTFICRDRIGFNTAFPMLASLSLRSSTDDLMYINYIYDLNDIFCAIVGEMLNGLGNSYFDSLVFFLCKCFFFFLCEWIRELHWHKTFHFNNGCTSMKLSRTSIKFKIIFPNRLIIFGSKKNTPRTSCMAGSSLWRKTTFTRPTHMKRVSSLLHVPNDGKHDLYVIRAGNFSAQRNNNHAS